ncbi:MAG: hypothetical protein QG636_368 [Patescibacteria group bacterium]|nr:hypothetical protein [Patescibacteria group bacterium]
MANERIQVRQGQGTDDSLNKVAELFASRGEKFDEEDAQMLQEKLPTDPGFPFMITALVVIKDLLDLVLDATVILAIVAWVLSAIIGIILVFWTFGKISGGWWKKGAIQWLWKRFFLMISVELIPFLNIMPTNVIYVLMVHYREKKIVKLFNEALEIFHGGGGGKPGVSGRQAFLRGLANRAEEDEEENTVSKAGRTITRLTQSPAGKMVRTATKFDPTKRTAVGTARFSSMNATRQKQLSRKTSQGPQGSEALREAA